MVAWGTWAKPGTARRHRIRTSGTHRHSFLAIACRVHILVRAQPVPVSAHYKPFVTIFPEILFSTLIQLPFFSEARMRLPIQARHKSLSSRAAEHVLCADVR